MSKEKNNIKRTVIDKTFGQVAQEYINDTNTHEGDFYCMDVIEDAVIDTIVMPDLTGDLDGETLPAGAKIFGSIESIKLTSGRVMAYSE